MNKNKQIQIVEGTFKSYLNWSETKPETHVRNAKKILFSD